MKKQPRQAAASQSVQESEAPRAFKTAWFAKKARAAGIKDAELCEAVADLNKGQGDDLGGNVWKKRLDKNAKRGIVVNKIGDFWVFVYLFAKSDRENIDERELKDFKLLARDYGKAKASDIDRLLESNELVEICNG
ncbi:type II toxin-antitoxin system RelE/ParE family toxin [Paraburkholderia tropica]|uniref:type II toxin-antitoxin system RelE/ParE family toxin n=1 Tax=Paraburkholderia tropica TaxID=92647 RepID=UPI0032B43CB2